MNVAFLMGAFAKTNEKVVVASGKNHYGANKARDICVMTTGRTTLNYHSWTDRRAYLSKLSLDLPGGTITDATSNRHGRAQCHHHDTRETGKTVIFLLGNAWSNSKKKKRKRKIRRRSL